MRSYTFKIAISALITISAFTPMHAKSTELNLSFTDESALMHFSDNDWTLLKTTAIEALDNSPDGSSHFWQNHKTGHSGTISLILTRKQAESLCRKAKFVNTADNLTTSTTAVICKTEGEWKVSERQDNPTADNTLNVVPNSTSVLYNSPTNTSSDSVTKSLGQTSEYCQDLSKKIEDLKGNPQRRSVARELYRSECQRVPRSSPSQQNELSQ